MNDQIYDALLANIGHHCTLDPNVPAEVGCAEAASFILRQAGIEVPAEGIEGTDGLLAFALAHPETFEETDTPVETALVIFASGTGNGKLQHGHTGYFGVFGKEYPGEWAIVSNDSQSGLLLELWKWSKMQLYYAQYGGMKPRIFVIKS